METQDKEMKSSWNPKYLATLCAFANGVGGGVMTIGIRDNGEVIGVDDPQGLLKVIPDDIRNKLGIVASVEPVIINGKTCITITVEKGDRHIDLDGVFYKRVGNTTQRVTGEELRAWILEDAKMTWTDLPSKAGIDSVSEEAVKHFVDAGKTADRLPQDLGYDKRTILERFDLIGKNGKLTNAGWLLFGQDSSNDHDGTFVKIGEFSDDGELRREDRIFVPVIMQPDAVMDVLYEKYIPGLYEYEGARRYVVFRYPKKAVREALVNAIVHKKYDDFEPITVRVDPNELSIYNSGPLPEGWTVEDLKNPHKSIRRNKTMAEVFHKAGYVEAWGKGIGLIRKVCKENGNPDPAFNVRQGGLDTRFLPNKTINIPLKLPSGLNENEFKICELINENREITVPEIIERLKISKSTVKRTFRSLTEKGIIMRVGPNKGGSWKFI
jgi:ATP-dependent DNA helicase RecG